MNCGCHKKKYIDKTMERKRKRIKKKKKIKRNIFGK